MGIRLTGKMNFLFEKHTIPRRCIDPGSSANSKRDDHLQFEGQERQLGGAASRFHRCCASAREVVHVAQSPRFGIASGGLH